MRPFLEDQRDKALLRYPDKELKVGDVILACIRPEKADDTAPRREVRYALHRIVAIEGDNITMYGDGNFSPEHIKRTDVLAIATGFYRNGKEKLDSVDSMSYKVYWKTWVGLRPMRRYLLILWRLKHYPKETLKKIKHKICK